MRVLIVDDHPIVRNGVRSAISTNPNWEICGEAGSGEAAHAMALQTNPDLVVLDFLMPGLGWLDLVKLLRRDVPEAKLLAFTLVDDMVSIRDALAAGVKGYVVKSEGDVQLIAAANALAAGRSYYSPTVVGLMSEMATQRGDGINFTQREVQVIQLLSKGFNNRAVAEELGLAEKTIENHRGSALRKAGVHTSAELVRYAIRHKVIGLED